jgi:hypothetical protein
MPRPQCVNIKLNTLWLHVDMPKKENIVKVKRVARISSVSNCVTNTLCTPISGTIFTKRKKKVCSTNHKKLYIKFSVRF